MVQFLPPEVGASLLELAPLELFYMMNIFSVVVLSLPLSEVVGVFVLPSPLFGGGWVFLVLLDSDT